MEARHYAETIVETVRDPLFVLDADLKIISSNGNAGVTAKAPRGGIVKKVMIACLFVLFFAGNGDAVEFPVPGDPAKAVQQADTTGQPQDVNNPEDALPTEQQQKSSQSTYFGENSDRPVSAYKVNYFSVDHWPGDNDAQVKFQISMKFRVLEHVLKYNLFPAYFAYTQKSLWNGGQQSMPFKEKQL